MMLDSLMLRDAPRDADLTTRSLLVRASTANDEDRSIEGLVTTEAAVTVYDWSTGRTIDEILLNSGAELPDQAPLLANHSRWSLDDVLGSARGFRIDQATDGTPGISARMFFARDDVEAEKAWNKARQGHLRDLSAGYRVIQSVEIQAGQSAAVGGRTFTAGKLPLRVATSWSLREVSVTPIGADSRTKTRSEKGPRVMDETENRAATEATSQPAAPTAPVTPPPAEPARNAATDPAEVSRQAIAAERERVRSLRTMAGADVPAEILTRAVDEGWDEARASREFLTAVRTARQPSQVPYTPSAYTGPAPAQSNANARALAAGVLAAHGIADPTQCVMHSGRREPRPEDRLTAQDAEQGGRFRRLSISDLIRHAAFIDTGRAFIDTDDALDAVRTSPSGGTLAYVFTTSMYAKLVEGWGEVPDTTTWCDTEDVPNFLTQEDISLSMNARLDQHPRGATARDATLSDSRETYKIARYSKKFTVDEMDQIDDRFGAIMKMPQEMGAAARRTRPDLVYSLLLANAALADTGALFNNTAVSTAGGHANLTTAVLGATGLKAAILAMGKYRDGDQVLNIKPRFLIVPSALQWTAKELLTSTAQAYTAAAAAATPSLYYPINVLVGEGLTLVVDDRIGAAGCFNPTTRATVAGSDAFWFLSAGGSRTVRVAYRAGTGRMPVMRSYMLDRGQWGMGWDINLDIGAKALDYRGLHKSTGAG